MAVFKLTKKDWEAHPHLEARQILLGLISAWTVDNLPVESFLDSVQLIENKLRELGYSGPEINVATYAENRFRSEDEGIVAPLWSTDEAEIEDEGDAEW